MTVLPEQPINLSVLEAFSTLLDDGLALRLPTDNEATLNQTITSEAELK